MKTSESLDHLGRLDLNLLITLHMLLETCSTTLTAAAIHRTQPAVSVSLRRLRDYFDDPLLEKDGRTLVPTPFALLLKHPLRRIIYSIDHFVQMGSSFDASTTNRSVTLAIPDIAQSITAKIVNQLRAEAPNLRINLAKGSLDITDYSEGLTLLLNGNVDLLFSFYIGDVPVGVDKRSFANQSWSVIARRDHPISSAPTLEEWASYGHIQINSGATGRTPVDDLLATFKVSRQVCLKMDGFLQALHMVASSDLLLTTMTPLISPLVDTLALTEVPLPFEIPPVPCCIMTRAVDDDPISAWLLDQALIVMEQWTNSLNPQ